MPGQPGLRAQKSLFSTITHIAALGIISPPPLSAEARGRQSVQRGGPFEFLTSEKAAQCNECTSMTGTTGRRKRACLLSGTHGLSAVEVARKRERPQCRGWKRSF